MTNPHNLICVLRQRYRRGRNVQFLLDVLRGTRRTTGHEVLLHPRPSEILLAQHRDRTEQHSRNSSQSTVSQLQLETKSKRQSSADDETN